MVIGNSDLYFELTDDPKTGDILFADAEAREKSYNHWALVKSSGDGAVTLIEQNWIWNGQAGVERVIPFPGCYAAYTLRSRSGAAITPVKGSPAGASKWAEPYIEQAEAQGVFQLTHDYTAPVTREDFCQMALNILWKHGAEITGSGASGAVEIGLVSDGDGAKLINREEAACIAHRLIARISSSLQSVPGTLEVYADAGEISSWARESVAQMTALGLMNGSSERFNPKTRMTNEQAVTLMVRVNEFDLPENP